MKMTTHPELTSEQRYLDYAVDCLQAMKRSASGLTTSAQNATSRSVANALDTMGQGLLGRLDDAERSVCFGRLDREDGLRLYVGRARIADGVKLVVMSWASDAATPFYEASDKEPMGLVRRRRLLVNENTLLNITDEVFAALPQAVQPAVLPSVVEAPARLPNDRRDAPERDALPSRKRDVARPSKPRGPSKRIEAARRSQPPTPPGGGALDAVLAALERERTPEMRDIVPTILADQHRLIRDKLDGVLVVQGGPGTGKTAVALHRAAWLLYNNRKRLGREGVLVVGPNRAFMDYVAEVLPSLGETSVDQSDVDHLVSAARASTHEEPKLRRLKGDPRMAAVIRRAIQGRIRIPENGLRTTFRRVRIELSRERLGELALEHGAKRTYMDGRQRFRNAARAAAYAVYLEGRGDHGEVANPEDLNRHLTADADWRNGIERAWPTLSAPQLVFELLTISARLSAAAKGLLEPAEHKALLRQSTGGVGQQRWTAGDLPLLDEAETLLNGRRESYGYVIVDEAQDLTPMQLRMVSRRARGSRMTLVGDIAQSTGPWSYNSWSDVLAQLPQNVEHRLSELTYGYRVPRQIMDLATRLLPHIAPDLEPTLAVRAGRSEPRIERVEEESLIELVAVEALGMAEEGRTVGIIVPAAGLPAVRGALDTAGAQVGDIFRDGLKRQITLLAAENAKGLEFDNVVVVEPAAIAHDGPHGLQGLYVALTRATQRLTIVHAHDLPDLLVDDVVAGPPALAKVRPTERAQPATARGAAPRRIESVEHLVPAGASTTLGSSFTEALIYVKLLYEGRLRRGSSVPYLSHLLAVAALVLEDGGTEAEAVAALLHDVPEDHGLDRLPVISRRFGGDVAKLVAVCADPPAGRTDSWRTTKRRHLYQLESAPTEGRRISLAEKLDNARFVVHGLRTSGAELWRQMNVEPDDVQWHFDELAVLFQREHPGAMSDALTEVCAKMRDLAQTVKRSG